MDIPICTGTDMAQYVTGEIDTIRKNALVF